MSFKGFISVAFALALLIGLFVVASKHPPPSDGDNKPPPTEPARFTGYSSWHPKIGGDDIQHKLDTSAALDSVVLLIGGVLTFRWAFVEKLPKNVISYFHSDSGIFPTTSLNRFISFYCLATFSASIASIAFDIGKLWSVFGALHNLMEVAILLLIGQNGKIKGNSFYLLWAAYYLIVNSVCLFADFPIDGLFFKVQGLAVDYALVIEYTRIFINTKKNLNEADLQLPLNTDENRDGDGDLSSTFAIHHPRQWLLMMSAGTVHLLGNIIVTMGPANGTSNLAFQLSYAVAFLLYVLYVFFDTHSISAHGPKRFYLPETSGAKTAVLAIISFWLSLSTILIGVIVFAPKKN